MTEPQPEAAATEAPQETAEPTKPTETVDFWKGKAREQEKRAKENADARKELDAIRDAQKSESEKAQEKVTRAEAEVASLPAKVAEALRTHLVALHEIDPEDAELFLTAAEPELLLKQVDRLLGQQDKRRKQGNHVPREGNIPATGTDDRREVVRNLFTGG